MTTPLPPNYTYFNGSSESSVFYRRGEAVSGSTGPTGPTGPAQSLSNPFTIQSENTQQKIVMTATGDAQSILIRNDALEPDAVAVIQLSNEGKLQAQTIVGTTQLLDPLVTVGNGLQNASMSVIGQAGASLTISQIGDQSRFINPVEEPSGGMQFYASTNSVQYVLAPRDKNAAIQVQNRTFFTSTRSAEFGLTETGVGYVQTNGGSQFNIAEPTVVVGNGVGTPTLNVSGSSGDGLVYDRIYNPPTTVGSTYTYPSNTLTTNQQLLFNATPGLYQLQAMITLENDGNISFGDSIRVFIERPDGSDPLLYRDLSEIHIMSTMMKAPTGPDEVHKPTFTSGVFEITTANEYAIKIQPTGSWNFGTIGSAVPKFNVVRVN